MGDRIPNRAEREAIAIGILKQGGYLSDREVAARAGISHPTVSKLRKRIADGSQAVREERKRATRATALALCGAPDDADETYQQHSSQLTPEQRATIREETAAIKPAENTMTATMALGWDASGYLWFRDDPDAMAQRIVEMWTAAAAARRAG